MRRPVFRLQRALQFALLRENQKKQQVASGLQRISFLNKYLARLDGQLREAIVQSRAVHTLAGDAHRQSIQPTLDEQKRLGILLEEELEALTKRRRELIHLSQRRRSLESLKEKKQKEFRSEADRKEQKRLDEWVSMERGRAVAGEKDRE